MKILFAVHQFFPHHYTGSERLVLNLCKQMQRMGHKVKVLTFALSETDGFIERCGVLVKEYEYQGVPVISIRQKIISDFVNFSIFDDELAAISEDILNRGQFEIVHVCHPMRIGNIIKSAHKKGIPVILTLTDFWLICPRGIATKQNGSLCAGSIDGMNCMTDCYPGEAWKSRINERFQQTRELFHYASAVVSSTFFLKSIFETNGYYRDISIIHYGKDYQYIQKNERKYSLNSTVTIGYLSSMNPHKGAHILLKAFREVQPANMKVKIYGDPKPAPHYFAILQDIAKGNTNIEFCGKYEYEEMPEIFKNIDVIAVPSIWWENSPLVLLRSMAHTVPAIVSNLGGLTEIVTCGLNGFAFNIGSSEQDTSKNLSEIIRIISSDPQILNGIKANIISPPRIEEESFEYECLYMAKISPLKNQPLIVASKKKSGSPEQDPIFPAKQDSSTIYRQKYGELLVCDIHPDDAMFQFLVNHPAITDPEDEYFRSGQSMITTLKEILKDQKIQLQSTSTFLDFASGYGRFTRFLIFELPQKKVTVSDIDKNAVKFCKEKFNVEGCYSSEDPKDFPLQEKFDMIWVASLFSHLTLQLWQAWLVKLTGLLNPGGTIIFSTHGCYCFQQLDEKTKSSVHHLDHGFYFIGKSEIDILPNDKYGTTYVTEKFVRDFVEKNKLGTITGYYPKKLWDFQDVFVLKIDDTKK